KPWHVDTGRHCVSGKERYLRQDANAEACSKPTPGAPANERRDRDDHGGDEGGRRPVFERASDESNASNKGERGNCKGEHQPVSAGGVRCPDPGERNEQNRECDRTEYSELSGDEFEALCRAERKPAPLDIVPRVPERGEPVIEVPQ